MRPTAVRARLLLLLALPLLLSCGRIKSCARSVLRGDDDDDEPKAPAVHNGPAAETPIHPHPRLLLDKPTLDALHQRVAAGTPTWVALDAKCKSRMAGPVEWPDGKDYPDPGIGEGYQGGDYWEAIFDLGLCYQMLKGKDDARAKAIAARVADVLEKMSALDGPHFVNPLRDDGFGIRFFVTGMAIGYDWVDADLPPELKDRVRASMQKWIDTYEAKGFGRNHPQGNYFAGYYAAKAFAALATQGDWDKSPTWWSDWLERVHRKMVQPYYAKHMVGGGWPEGWNYGPFATINMTWPAWAAYTAKDLNLFRDPHAPYTFPFDQALHLVHFAWPDRIHVDDRGKLYEGEFDDVGGAPVSTLTVLPALLRRFDDPFAPVIQHYAREVRERRPKKKNSPWMDFLYWDAAAPEGDYSKLQRSFVAWGMQTAAMRSGWDEQAVWASFTAGTYVGSPDSGEMYFDQGSLAIVHGNRPVLVNATAAIQRYAPGEPEAKGEDVVYEDLFGNHDKDVKKGNRTLFNVFYARVPPLVGGESQERYGQIAAVPGKAKTHLRPFEDKDAWVLLRGENLEDMYKRGKRNEQRVTSWTRQVLYVRPSVFVIEDKTGIADADYDQWLAFHLPFPVAARAGESTFDAGAADKLAGTLSVVYPPGAATKTVDLFDRHKVVRVEVRPKTKEKEQRWLTVIDAAPPGPGATKVHATDGAVGAIVELATGPLAVVAADGGTAKYKAPLGATHYLTGLAPHSEVHVSATRDGAGFAIAVEKGAGIKASEGGVVAFKVDEGGQATALVTGH